MAMKGFIISFLLQFVFVVHVKSWNEGPGSVLLRDVNALTLYEGRYTTARRSSPVLQLQCVGGSAGCGTLIVPEVVQCANKGWDGVDAQWECKTDMDNAYRFGPVEVTCEVYSHADDPYILTGSCGLEYTLELTQEGRQRGSCGLEYTLELTEEGRQTGSCGLEYTLELTEEGRQRGQGADGAGSSFGGFDGDFASSLFSGNNHHQQQQQQQQQHSQQRQQSSSPLEGILLGVAVLQLITLLLFLALFLSRNGTPREQEHGGQRHPGDENHGYNAGSPPPGFEPDFTGFEPDFTGPSPDYAGANPGYAGATPGYAGATPGYAGANPGYAGATPGYGFHSDYTNRQHYPGGRSSSAGTGGGFWRGMGTGGMLGYLFGSQSSQSNTTHYTTDSGTGPARDSTFSTGTRTASGFGGRESKRR